MCPLCMTTAALVAGGFLSTGGVAALVVQTARRKRPATHSETAGPSHESPGAGVPETGSDVPPRG